MDCLRGFGVDIAGRARYENTQERVLRLLRRWLL
jgi:hypothetical protein